MLAWLSVGNNRKQWLYVRNIPHKVKNSCGAMKLDSILHGSRSARSILRHLQCSCKFLQILQLTFNLLPIISLKMRDNAAFTGHCIQTVFFGKCSNFASHKKGVLVFQNGTFPIFRCNLGRLHFFGLLRASLPSEYFTFLSRHENLCYWNILLFLNWNYIPTLLLIVSFLLHL